MTSIKLLFKASTKDSLSSSVLNGGDSFKNVLPDSINTNNQKQGLKVIKYKNNNLDISEVAYNAFNVDIEIEQQL